MVHGVSRSGFAPTPFQESNELSFAAESWGRAGQTSGWEGGTFAKSFLIKRMAAAPRCSVNEESYQHLVVTVKSPIWAPRSLSELTRSWRASARP